MTASATQPLLVFGDDGSPPSDVAWAWVNRHPWSGWGIEVMTAHFEEAEIEWGRPPHPEPWRPPWTRPRSADLGTDSVHFLRVTADPRAMLAGRPDADLIVVGIRARRPLEALWMGSTTEWLLQHPPAPLAVIRSSPRVERVSICVDGSDHAMLALAAFAALPLAGSATITLLTVDDGRVVAAEALASAQAALAERGLKADEKVEAGRPTTVILEHLDQERPDLVVLGTRGLTGWERLRMGSTAAAVARATPSSCLVACAERAAGR